MRRLILAAVMVLMAATAARAQTFDLGQPLTAVWDPVENESASAVTVYQLQVGAGEWASVPQPVPQPTYRYNIPQALLILGTQTIGVRACRPMASLPTTLECGAESSRITFTIGRPLPGAPRNPRVIPTPPQAVLTIPQAIDRANAYSLLILDRPLSQLELNTLSMRHGNVPPTRESVFRVLDASFADFVVR